MIDVFTAVKSMALQEQHNNDLNIGGGDNSDSALLEEIILEGDYDLAGNLNSAFEKSLMDHNISSPLHLHSDTHDEDDGVVIYPIDDVFDDALSKGLVLADVQRSVVKSDVVYFMVEVSMLSIPGLMESYSSTKSFSLKRYADFKALHLDLTHVVHGEQEIPPLPTREVMSIGVDIEARDERDRDEPEEHELSEEDLKFLYISARQRYLKKWLSTVLVRQSSEGRVYRQVLKNFFMVKDQQ